METFKFKKNKNEDYSSDDSGESVISKNFEDNSIPRPSKTKIGLESDYITDIESEISSDEDNFHENYFENSSHINDSYLTEENSTNPDVTTENSNTTEDSNTIENEPYFQKYFDDVTIEKNDSDNESDESDVIIEENNYYPKIEISNPQFEPFGVLHPNHFTEFVVETENKLINGKWQTLNQFIYVNMFKNEVYRKKISESLPNPFEKMFELHAMQDLEIYEHELIYGLRKRFENDKNLTQELKKTKGFEFEFDIFIENADIINQLFEEIRYEASPSFLYDRLSKKMIPKSKVRNVLYGLEKRLKNSNSFDEINNLNDNLPFEDVKKYGEDTTDSIDVDKFDVNQLVKIAKIRFHNDKIEETVNNFKNDLLDEYLNYVLETNYPYISKENYSKAKKEQFNKEKSETVGIIKEQIFEIFLKGSDLHFHQDIISRVKKIPTNFSLKYASVSDSSFSSFSKIKIESNSSFLPNFQSPFTLDGRNFVSVIHYVYFKLIENLREISSFDKFENFNVNDFEIQDLVLIYQTLKNEWIEFTLKKLCEYGTSMKFQFHIPVMHTLFSSYDLEIEYNSIDSILGMGPNGEGKNILGKYLVFLRYNVDYGQIPNYTIRETTVDTNVVLKTWFFSWALELRNVMLLLDEPNLKELKIIYGKNWNNDKYEKVQPTSSELKIFENAGLTKVQISACFPLIMYEFEKIKNMPLSDFSKMQAEKYLEESSDSRINGIYDSSNFEKDYNIAMQNLEKISEIVDLGPGVTKFMFVQSLLCRRQVFDGKLFTPQRSQVKRWANFSKKIERSFI